MIKELYEALRWAHEDLHMFRLEIKSDDEMRGEPSTRAIAAYKAMKFHMGDKVRKISGARWKGTVVGFYSTTLTPEGYAVESDTEIGSVQIYPAKALELTKGDEE